MIDLIIYCKNYRESQEMYRVVNLKKNYKLIILIALIVLSNAKCEYFRSSLSMTLHFIAQ